MSLKQRIRSRFYEASVWINRAANQFQDELVITADASVMTKIATGMLITVNALYLAANVLAASLYASVAVPAVIISYIAEQSITALRATASFVGGVFSKMFPNKQAAAPDTYWSDKMRSLIVMLENFLKKLASRTMNVEERISESQIIANRAQEIALEMQEALFPDAQAYKAILRDISVRMTKYLDRNNLAINSSSLARTKEQDSMPLISHNLTKKYAATSGDAPHSSCRTREYLRTIRKPGQ